MSEETKRTRPKGITFMANDEEKEIVLKLAKKNGMSLSGFLRWTILNHPQREK